MSFTVIGAFETPVAAASAAEALRDAVIRVARWHVEHPFKSRKLFSGGAGARRMIKPSPAEQDLAAKYGVDWSQGHGWLAVDTLDDLGDPVSTLEAYLFLTSGETDITAAPFDALVAALGGRPLVDDAAGSVRVSLSATAADPVGAAALRESLLDYVESVGLTPAPWMVYAGGEYHPDADELLSLEPDYLHLLRALSTGEPESDELPDLDPEDAEWLDDVRGAVHFSLAEAGHIGGEKVLLMITNAIFAEIASGLP
ncbi:MAG: hypothetical protein ACOCYT_05545, partial [Chloroflexota bacterium]